MSLSHLQNDMLEHGDQMACLIQSGGAKRTNHYQCDLEQGRLVPHQLPGEKFGFQIYVIHGFQGQIAVIIRFQTTFIRFLV